MSSGQNACPGSAHRPVSSGITAAGKIYDGGTAATVSTAAASLAGLLAGDVLSVSATGAFDNKNVGAGKTVTLASVYGGADLGNYAITGLTATTASVTPKALAVSGISAANKVYDANTTATVNAGTATLNGLVAGDAFTLSVTGAFVDKNAAPSKTVNLASSYSGTDLGNYAITDQVTTTASITPAPATITANSLSKVYGETTTLSGGAFAALGLVAGENIGAVTLASAGTPALAGVAGSPYAVDVSDARGGNFSATNYSLTYVGGRLTVTPRPLTVATNSVVRFADEANPTSYGFSTSVGGLVGGDGIASVLQTAPAGSSNAPGGSVFELLPSGAVFGVGTPGNYALRYGSGLLVVLPKPPRLGDTDGTATGGDVNFAIQIDEAEVKRAAAELDRTLQALNAPPPRDGNRDGNRDGTDGAPSAEQPPAEGTPAEITLLLAGDSRSITLPLLQKLPLISFDPQLRRLIFGGQTPPPAR